MKTFRLLALVAAFLLALFVPGVGQAGFRDCLRGCYQKFFVTIADGC